MEIRNFLRGIFSLFIVLSVILLIFAYYSWQHFFVTGAMYAQIGVAQLLMSAIALMRLPSSKGDPMEIGKVGIQHSWIILSIGLAGVALFLAPYFDIGLPIITYTAFAIALLYLVIGAFSLYKTNKDTGQFLSI